MKNLLFITFLFVSVFSYSQTINGVDIKSYPISTFEVIGEVPLRSEISLKLKSIAFDLGTQDERLETKQFVVKDKDGNDIAFQTMGDVLIFFDGNGYELYLAYSSAIEKTNRIYHHYFFRKKQ